MRSGDEQGDRQPSVFVADVEVAQATEVSEGDSTATVELVTADSVLDRWGGERRAGLESGLEGLKRSPTIDRSMRSLLVVVEAEGVELELKMSRALGWGLPLQVALQGLVEALDFAAGLGVIRTRVPGLDSQSVELRFEHDPALAWCAAEDRRVVAQELGRIAIALSCEVEGLKHVWRFNGAEGDRGEAET